MKNQTPKQKAAGAINKPELKVKCLHCGREFIDKFHHKCNIGFRKRNHNWKEI